MLLFLIQVLFKVTKFNIVAAEFISVNQYISTAKVKIIRLSFTQEEGQIKEKNQLTSIKLLIK